MLHPRARPDRAWKYPGKPLHGLVVPRVAGIDAGIDERDSNPLQPREVPEIDGCRELAHDARAQDPCNFLQAA